ncbi:MAG TPA: methylated-DNA--[protein]-cysteine S-methyltransferase [Terracidiphilus sp.]|jgi:AraC family transcriptional regulator of adaptative response/methylated-DNA-[protein]-cysteine methyltransferase|nr:methylated-DNA--[protein]-cysteine S-methyltransferase [Terracidiphilus sp.]
MNAILQPALDPAMPAATINADAAWQQLLARDPAAGFVYAVTTTGVFCRPGCSSRRPLRQNVRFFPSPDQAAAAGFRACRRCKPANQRANPIDRVRRHIEANLDRAVPLAELGRIASLSPFTVQRLFKKEMGASPLQYRRALLAGRFRSALKQGSPVTGAIYDAGFGSSSRAYEASPLGMTPARFAHGGRGERIGWCAVSSPFGWIIVGVTDRGLCWLSLAGSEAAALRTLQAEFPEADLHADASLRRLVDAALASVREGSDLSAARLPGALDLRGTVFQLRVWQALRQIPRGQTRTYGELARELGQPTAARAVARACATNRVALLVPCHRIIGADGNSSGYRWGRERKERILAAERT